MKGSIFKEPNQWILFIAITIATVNGVVSEQYFTLLVGVPFMLVSVLSSVRFYVHLWMLFITGAIINVILIIASSTDYFVGGVYLLLVFYGLYELLKLINERANTTQVKNSESNK